LSIVFAKLIFLKYIYKIIGQPKITYGL